jgi:SAM-dependent methyltransferase
MSGELSCTGCAENYPIVRGVPRFADLGEIDEKKAATAEGFGFEWRHFTQKDDRYAEQFLGWLDPVEPEFFKDKIVLDGGCGKGRHMRLAADWGAKEVIGVDLSDAVETAFEEFRGSDNLHVVQADLCRLPLKRIVDYAYSVGVIDHTPEPVTTFRSIASKIKPGGSMSVWVYGAENNWWITNIITPVRERFTSKISPRALLHLSKVPTAMVYAASKFVYAPLNKFAAGRAIAGRLFYNDYMQVIAGFGWMEQHNIVFDHLVSPTVTYSTREEFTGWWDAIGAEDVRIGWHNKNSWRGTGRVTK